MRVRIDVVGRALVLAVLVLVGASCGSDAPAASHPPPTPATGSSCGPQGADTAL